MLKEVDGSTMFKTLLAKYCVVGLTACLILIDYKIPNRGHPSVSIHPPSINEERKQTRLPPCRTTAERQGALRYLHWPSAKALPRRTSERRRLPSYDGCWNCQRWTGIDFPFLTLNTSILRSSLSNPISRSASRSTNIFYTRNTMYWCGLHLPGRSGTLACYQVTGRYAYTAHRSPLKSRPTHQR